MCTSVGLCVKPVKIDQYTDLRSQLRSSYYQFFGSCWQVTEKFRVNLCFETSEHSVETTDDNNNVTLQAPVTTLVSYVFKLVSYFDSVVISNQIKYCLATSRGNFLQVQYGFCRFVMVCCWKTIYQELKKVKPGTWLFGASCWKIIKELCTIWNCLSKFYWPNEL